jgi:hypothetical protein
MSSSPDPNASDIAAHTDNDAPQVEALFLIKFDKKVGYVRMRQSNSLPEYRHVLMNVTGIPSLGNARMAIYP